MTDAEILEEARKDFFELSGKVRMALERFANRHYRMAVNNGLCINDVARGLIPRTVEQRQWPTRRRNVWRTYFCFDNLPGGGARRVCQYFIYIPLYRETGTEYLFFHGCDKFFVERFTLHFVERYKERHLAGLRFNEMVASGELAGPIVIGRDHLDSGSVASPYRETESMLDGSDAIADWPLLNALTATSSGATWVSIHHGGGVGIGRSIHAGQVGLADGTDLAAQKLDRLLTNDPGMGVLRHVDAGYARAAEVADERGVQVPMAPTIRDGEV